MGEEEGERMITRELIAKLQELDPSGEMPVVKLREFNDCETTYDEPELSLSDAETLNGWYFYIHETKPPGAQPAKVIQI